MLDDPLETFVSAYNETFETNHSASRVDFGRTTSNLAKCGKRHGDNVAYFAINEPKWRGMSNAEKAGLITYELGHIEQNGHPPEFWDEVGRIAKKLTPFWKQYAPIDDYFRWLIYDPQEPSVDNRSETVYECRRRMASKFEVDVQIEPLSGIRFASRRRPHCRRMSVNDFDFELKSPLEICQWLRSHDGPKREFDRYILEPGTNDFLLSVCKFKDLDVRVKI